MIFVYFIEKQVLTKLGLQHILSRLADINSTYQRSPSPVPAPPSPGNDKENKPVSLGNDADHLARLEVLKAELLNDLGEYDSGRGSDGEAFEGWEPTQRITDDDVGVTLFTSHTQLR